MPDLVEGFQQIQQYQRTTLLVGVDLDVVGDVREVVRGWKFFAEPKLDWAEETLCKWSDFAEEKFFQDFA